MPSSLENVLSDAFQLALIRGVTSEKVARFVACKNQLDALERELLSDLTDAVTDIVQGAASQSPSDVQSLISAGMRSILTFDGCALI